MPKRAAVPRLERLGLAPAASGRLLAFALHGHTKNVMALLLDPAEKWLASVSEDRTLRIWDLHSQREAIIGEGHRKGIYALERGFADNEVISGSDDKTIRFWRIDSASPTRELVAPARVYCLATWREKKHVFAGCTDGLIRGWLPGEAKASWQAGAKLGRGSFDYAKRLIVSSALGRLFVAQGRFVIAYDLATAEEVGRYEGHTDPVEELSLDAAGARLACVSKKKVVHLLDARTLKLTSKLLDATVLHNAPVYCLEFLPDDKLLSIDADARIKLWDLATGAFLRHWDAPGLTFSSAVSASGERLYLGGHPDLGIRALDLGARVDAFHSGEVTSVLLSQDGQLALSMDTTGRIGAWKPGANTPARWVSQVAQGMESLAWARDGQTLLYADGQVREMDVESGKTLRSFGVDRMVRVAPHPDGVRVLAIHENKALDGTLALWDVERGARLSLTIEDVESTCPLRLSPNGEWFVVAFRRGDGFTLGLFNFATWEGVPIANAQSVKLRACFSADSRTLWVTQGSSLSVWDVATGKRERTVRNVGQQVEAGPGARACSIQGTQLTVWDASTWTPLAELVAEVDWTSCALGRDVLVAGNAAGEVHFFKPPA